jgi:phosphatidylserine synthase
VSEKKIKHHWLAVAQDPPVLKSRLWLLSYVVGAIFVIAALAQLASLNTFENNLAANGIGWAAFTAAVLVLTELWAAAGFFKLRLSRLFRAVANFFALATSGFWFYESLRQAAEGAESSYSVNGHLTVLGSNFFGKYLNQVPGWGTIAEITVFFFLGIFLLEKMRPASNLRSSTLTK